MNIDLLKKLETFYINANKGLYIDEIIEKKNCVLGFSRYVNDADSNFVTKINVKSNSIESLENEIIDEFNKRNKKICYIVGPLSDLYKNREFIFNNKKYVMINDEVWQVYDNLDNFKSYNNDNNINIEICDDMDLIAKISFDAFNTGDTEDPYGEFDEGYIELYKNYNKDCITKYKKEFYIIKVNNEIVGCTVGTYDEEIYGIYGLAIIKKYRGKGIGTEVIKQQLKRACELNKKMVFLQTEDGYYPAKLYRKIGFKDVCNIYYYLKNKV